MHAALATLFFSGGVVAYLERTEVAPGRFGASEAIVHWETVAMAFGLSIANVIIALSKRRRAARLSVDPDSDHPEAKVFE